jgi:hypothetical protein
LHYVFYVEDTLSLTGSLFLSLYLIFNFSIWISDFIWLGGMFFWLSYTRQQLHNCILK